MRKMHLLFLLTLSLSKVLATSHSLDGFYSNIENHYYDWIEIKDDSLFIICCEEDTMAQCSISRIDESFLEINTGTPNERLMKGLIVTKDTNAIVPEDSIKIIIHMPYQDSISMYIYNCCFAVKEPQINFANGYQSFFMRYPNEGDLLFSIRPITDNELPFSSSYRGHYHSKEPFFTLIYHLLPTDKIVEFNFTNFNDNFLYAMASIEGEYIRIIDSNTIVWRGITYTKQKKMRPWNIQPIYL